MNAGVILFLIFAVCVLIGVPISMLSLIHISEPTRH